MERINSTASEARHLDKNDKAQRLLSTGPILAAREGLDLPIRLGRDDYPVFLVETAARRSIDLPSGVSNLGEPPTALTAKRHTGELESIHIRMTVLSRSPLPRFPSSLRDGVIPAFQQVVVH